MSIDTCLLAKDFMEHEHPLIFNPAGDEDEKPKLCKLCGLLMFAGTPFYSCSIPSCTSFFLHKHCAGLSQRFSDQESFDDAHNPFTLLSQPRTEACMCLKCGQTCKNFTYCSTNIAYNGTGIHPLCAFPDKLETLHRSHRKHALSPTHREMCALCIACGEEERGIFFSCQQCDYWLHQDCASLPPVAKHPSHVHPLVLLYSYPFPKGEFSWGSCRICDEDMPLRHGVYSCRACDYGAHLKCMKSSLKDLTPEESRELVVHLPPTVEDSVFPSLIIRAATCDLWESHSTTPTTSTRKMTPEKCHNHLLIFHDGDDEISKGVEHCNACIQPISSATPYYSCSESHCHFLVHELCANLPLEIWGKLLNRPMYLFTKWRGFFNIFPCEYCGRQCNGFGYSFDVNVSGGISLADVECASAPRIIVHESHKNHILQLTTSFDSSVEMKEYNCCSGYWPRRCFYQCISCEYRIHLFCALLPQQVAHKFDQHPLQLHTKGLTILSQQQSSEDDDFCEICEEYIDLSQWFYGCLECDNYFHVKCLSSVGHYSKFKFGGTVEDVPCHPQHPMTSVRMLTIGSQTCGHCNRTVHGFIDTVAFHCGMCDFWMHEYCVYENRGYKKP